MSCQAEYNRTATDTAVFKPYQHSSWSAGGAGVAGEAGVADEKNSLICLHEATQNESSLGDNLDSSKKIDGESHFFKGWEELSPASKG